MEEEKILNLYAKWFNFANEDYEMAEIALKNNKLLFSAFHLQQALEKLFKGLYLLYIKEQPPYIHDLLRIYNVIKGYDVFLEEERFSKLSLDLNPFYITARYPSYKESVSNSLTIEQVGEYFKDVRDLMLWSKQKMK
ncbi:MAG: HEPN domain-containing protein [Oligoflexia bacterium]|nr:HEPN domain-containing protein [Oligoflexia bacterium]